MKSAPAAIFLRRPKQAETGRLDGGIGHGPDVHRDLTGDALAVHQAPFVAQVLDRLHEMDRVDVVHPQRRRMVAQTLVVSRQAEHVADAQRRGAQHVALDGQSIAIAQGHLQDRLGARLFEQHAAGEAGHAYHGDLVVGDVDRVAGVLEQPTLPEHDLALAAPRRSGLGGDGELATRQHAFELAA